MASASQASEACFFVLPVGAAFLLTPTRTALASGTAVAAYLAVSLTHPMTETLRDEQGIAVHALYLLWLGVAVTLLAHGRAQRRRRTVELADACAPPSATSTPPPLPLASCTPRSRRSPTAIPTAEASTSS